MLSRRSNALPRVLLVAGLSLTLLAGCNPVPTAPTNPTSPEAAQPTAAPVVQPRPEQRESRAEAVVIADYEVPGGRFYTQAAQGRGMPGVGFSVVDEGGVALWSSYRSGTTAQDLGFPISRRFWLDGAVHQVFEKGAVRQDPATGKVVAVDLAELARAKNLTPASPKAADLVGALVAGDVFPAAAFKAEFPILNARPGAPAPRIMLDPGHGGREVGARYRELIKTPTQDGVAGTRDLLKTGPGAPEAAPRYRELSEKDLGLKVALKAEGYLKAAGYEVLMTRRTDREVFSRYRDVIDDQDLDLPQELQARIDYANQEKVDLFISLHFNAGTNDKQSGVETYYCEERPFAAQNKRMAELLQNNMVDTIRGAGRVIRDKGIKEDSVLSDPGKHEHLYLLGPTYEWVYRWGAVPEGYRAPRIRRPTEMPAALGEALYVTNPSDRELLDQEWFLSLIGRSYAASISQYFGGLEGKAAADESAAAQPAATPEPKSGDTKALDRMGSGNK